MTLAAGLSHVVPAGVFQPSGIAPWNIAGDFDLWRNVLREFSEELLRSIQAELIADRVAHRAADVRKEFETLLGWGPETRQEVSAELQRILPQNPVQR